MMKLVFCPREREKGSQQKTLAEEIKKLLIDFSDECVEDVRLSGGKMGATVIVELKKDKNVNYSTEEVGTHLRHFGEIIQ